ncbi:uncharacterized protein LOC110690017 isoform X1 [Chenopodium quinoa]|uniref:uncharacterized protein LOC110690017 isoform X1 n=1 Tax=Chenopodium quinoa TaxID=63459 RepID=UPI000B76F42F|nr:uncharacterized protein LOC110690017 isoform X1 [Chenopodium quinoa]
MGSCIDTAIARKLSSMSVGDPDPVVNKQVEADGRQTVLAKIDGFVAVSGLVHGVDHVVKESESSMVDKGLNTMVDFLLVVDGVVLDGVENKESSELEVSVEIIRDHVICRGFRFKYHVWIWHCEKGEYSGDVDGNDVHNRSNEIRVDKEYDNDEYIIDNGDEWI